MTMTTPSPIWYVGRTYPSHTIDDQRRKIAAPSGNPLLNRETAAASAHGPARMPYGSTTCRRLYAAVEA
jgi:hypothetical protein